MNRRIIGIFHLLLVTTLSQMQAEELEVVKLSGREYVRLIDLCEFYGFPTPQMTKPQLLKGPYGTLELFTDDRKIEINGYRAWLSLPIRSAAKGLYVSKTDVDLLLAPILRPEEVVPRKKVKGVVIDAGHGGADRGARSSNGYTEKQAALFTALELRKLYEKSGIDVVMTRTRDVFVHLRDRARIANKYPEHIFISIHYNSVYVKSANGIETYSMTPRGVGSTSAGGRIRRSDYTGYNGNKHDINNTLLMNYMHEELMAYHTEKGDRGLKRARFLVLREVKIPAVLIEGGFMSHYIDARLIRSESYKKKVAAAIYRATRRYIDLVNSPKLPARSALKKQSAPTPSSVVTADEIQKTETTGPAGHEKPVVAQAEATEEKTQTTDLKAGAREVTLREPEVSELKAREREIVERLKRAIAEKLETEETDLESDHAEQKELTDGG
ncbi:MAG: N-acetylmuramoyl-L-alanine amidase [Verrucomicrobiota bacterium]